MTDTEQGTELMARDEVERAHAEHQDRSRLPDGMLEPMADANEIVEARAERSRLIADALEEGRDYGSVPGIPKPFLQKPGAEKLTAAFGCYPRFTVEDQEVDHDRQVDWEKQNGKSGESVGLYRYRVSCDIVHRMSGVVVGNGLGACSTMEDKYVESPRNAENTVLKMAKKRAHVDAVLSTFDLSEMFTQDADYVRNQGGAGPWDPDQPVGFGKHGEDSWREVVETDPDYAEWLQRADRTPDEAAEWIAGQLAEPENGDADLPEAVEVALNELAGLDADRAARARDWAEKAVRSGADEIEVLARVREAIDEEQQAGSGASGEASGDEPPEPASKQPVLDWFEQTYADDPTTGPDAKLRLMAKDHPELTYQHEDWSEEQWASVLAGIEEHGTDFVDDPGAALQQEVGV